MTTTPPQADKVLSRQERSQVLEQCLNNRTLIKRAYRASRLLEAAPDDVLNQIGIKIYEGLFYFRFIERYHGTAAPLETAYKLAVTTGHNFLTSWIRHKLEQQNLALPATSVDLSELQTTAMAAVSLAEVTNTMAAAATDLVGIERAAYLVRATLYDWEGHRDGRRLSAQQHEVMKGLGLTLRRQMVQLIEDFYAQVRRELEQPKQTLKKTDGVWRTTPTNLG